MRVELKNDITVITRADKCRCVNLTVPGYAKFKHADKRAELSTSR